MGTSGGTTTWPSWPPFISGSKSAGSAIRPEQRIRVALTDAEKLDIVYLKAIIARLTTAPQQTEIPVAPDTAEEIANNSGTRRVEPLQIVERRLTDQRGGRSGRPCQTSGSVSGHARGTAPPPTSRGCAAGRDCGSALDPIRSTR